MKIFKGHKSTILTVAITADDKYIISGSSDNFIVSGLWEQG